jgi:hypothetical protein
VLLVVTVVVVVLVAVVVSVTVVGVVVVVVEVSVIVVVGCLTVTSADCDLVGALVWVAVDVTVLAPTPATEASTNATARPATKAMIAAGQVHDCRG